MLKPPVPVPDLDSASAHAVVAAIAAGASALAKPATPPSRASNGSIAINAAQSCATSTARANRRRCVIGSSRKASGCRCSACR